PGWEARPGWHVSLAAVLAAPPHGLVGGPLSSPGDERGPDRRALLLRGEPAERLDLPRLRRPLHLRCHVVHGRPHTLNRAASSKLVTALARSIAAAVSATSSTATEPSPNGGSRQSRWLDA